ncbi:Protein FAM200B [Anabarilius grahami]|uniref:Protein FAM200B n=1 Tax=Anabarilius grahami TaxID=495550 RepID=A0A3N0Y9B8_ANAGA|nr:Protein FAM200B [Anabarilius grahami]
MLAQDVQSHLDAAIHTAPCVALAVDESTDINDNAQLVVYIRFSHAEKKDFIEDILEEYAEVMDTVMKLINFLRASSSLQHRHLREFLPEVDANANYLLLHCNVRWLSKGRVLARFWAVRNEIKMFLAQLKNNKARWFSKFLEDERKINIMAFLVDTTSHLNDLKLKLQGKNNSVCDLVAAIQSFQRKLDIFKEDLKEDCKPFPSLKQISERVASSHVEFIQKLIGNFRDRFVNFSLGDQLILFIQNPFLVKNVFTGG